MKLKNKYVLIIIFTMFSLFHEKSAIASACTLTSSVPTVTETATYPFGTNSNGAGAYGGIYGVFWSGSGDETYQCPSASKTLALCAVNSTNNTLAPGITSQIYLGNGTDTSVNHPNNCDSMGNTSEYPASGTIPSGFIGYNQVRVYFEISDSTQARNYSFSNYYAGNVTMENTNNASISDTPLTKVYISGSVTVPANCKLKSNSVVVLPDTYSGDYSKAGTGAKVGTGTTQPMSIACSGGSETATIDLHVTTNKVSGDDIVTSNSDVGVRVLDGSGNTISANNGKVSATLNNGTVDVPFTYVPVAITGKNPTPGDYSAIETITVTIP
ncbi:fimbrial protein [Klebsiella michiganensis]|uniref:fimbrial protein n=1 Tax=Klebsiella michiganensis TaxID=1134687 RepID=UPI0018C5E385|nr:fimbrial protein [Klebsiella michiganensis]MBG2623332.1 fimbrial protein [Klebsiella michiganensis]MBG2631756.1 fimbrial protein [Klebsiella michiganensis]